MSESHEPTHSPESRQPIFWDADRAAGVVLLAVVVGALVLLIPYILDVSAEQTLRSVLTR